MSGARIQLKRATAASWTSNNPVLYVGEIGFETDTKKLKIGDGTTAWTSLTYASIPIALSTLNDLSDVTITSAANGDFLRWNGTAWINDAVNLSADTVGSYVESLVAGTGVTLTNNSGEAATPTISIGQAVGTGSNVTFAGVTAPLTGNVTGNADTATTLATSRTIELTGDVTGSASFNGSANASIAATIQPNSVALGTDTVGNYVESLVAGTGVTLTNNSGEGATPTIAIGQSVGTTDSPTFAKVTLSGTPSASTDATTKSYVDNIAAGINFHDAVNLATAAALPNSPTYNNGTSGEGATLTATTNARLQVDGTNASNGNRILVKDQATPQNNGVYVVTVQGSVSTTYQLTRATDFDSVNNYIEPGDAFFVLDGAINAGNGFIVNSIGTAENQSGTGTIGRHILGTDEVNFTQFTGTATITAGNGLSKSGNILSINTATVATLSDAQTLTNKTLTSPTINNPTITGVSPVVTLDGDLSGSLTLTNLGSGTLTATIQPNSVALGTDTTGDYVAGLVAGTGVTLSNNSGETATPTIAIGQAVGTDSTVTFAGVTAPLTGNVTGNADTATTLATSRTIELTGDVTGSASFNGSANASITATIQPNSVALGTDTTGNYVSDVSAGTGVTVTHTPGEGSSPTIAIGQAVGTGSSVTFASVTAPLTGNVTGNADTATTLATSRTIELTGDVTGSASFDGSANASITATIAANSVALGTDTTGNYVSDVTGGTGVTVTHTPGEGSSPTIAIGQAVGTGSTVTFAGVTAPLTGNVTGNADTATTLATSRTIELTGDVTGSASFNGSANASIAATIQPNSVALGTDTTGDYVASLVAGTGVTLTDNSGETATPTIAIGQSVATNANPTFAGATLDAVQVGITAAGEIDTTSGNLTIDSAGGTVTVDDVLTVNGNINTSNQIRITGTTATSIPNVNGQQEAFLTVRASEASFADGNGPSLLLVRNHMNSGLTVSQYGNFSLTGGGRISGFTGDGGGGTVEIYGTNGATQRGLMVTANEYAASGNKIQTWQSHDYTINSFVKPDGSFSIRNVQVGLTAAGEIDTSSGNLTIDSAGGTVTVDDNLTVTGNLTVSGTTTTVNTETIELADNIIVFNSNASGAPSENAGIEIERGSSTNVLLRWNETSDKWEITTDGTTYDNIATETYAASLTPATLNDIGDVTITSAANGEFLKWNGSAWVNASIPTINTLDDVGDVTITSAASGDFLKWNGTAWVNDPINLATDTVGNYMADVSAGTGISVTHTAGEGSTATIAVGATVVQTTDTGTVTSAMIADGTIVNADINASAAIDKTKISGTAVTVADTGTVTSTMIADGTIVNADINASAAIELGKLADVSTNAQTDSYTLVLADKNKIVEMNKASANNLTVPLNSSVAFAVGSQINILQTGAGQTTVVATSGVTINATPGLKLRAQWSYATLIKRAENTWVLVGDVSA